MEKVRVSLMELTETEESAKVLSYAMLNNSIHKAVLMGAGEKERLILEEMFSDLLTNNPGIVFKVRVDGKIAGVMRMKSCCGSDIITKPDSTSNEDIEYRKYLWFKDWAENDPEYHHWHLGPIGVLPEHRKKGIGSMLMEKFISEVDACNGLSFLETDLDENINFYRKFGFEIVKRTLILGVESRFMERPLLKK